MKTFKIEITENDLKIILTSLKYIELDQNPSTPRGSKIIKEHTELRAKLEGQK